MIPAKIDNQKIPEPSGIFLKSQFPYKTKRTKFTPKQVYDALIRWATTKDGIDNIIDDMNIRRESFWILKEKYPEIRTMYEVARELHGHQLVLKARDCYEDTPEDAYIVDKWGNRQLSQSWVTYNRDKSNFLLRLAQIRETGTTIQRTQTQSESISYNVNIHAKAPNDVVESANNIEDLLEE